MVDPSHYPDPGDVAADDASGAPRWVYVLGSIALIVVLLVVILLLTSGGGHGPGRHTP